MGRRHAAALLLLAALAACGRAGPPDPRPNVLLVVVDTLRADALGTYGAPQPASPRIDALAAGGVVFERAIAAAPWTSPSHATLLTSLHVREHSVGFGSGTTKLTGAVTLAEHFRAAGYHTAAFVSNVMLLRSHGWDRGFELYDDELTAPETRRPEIVERVAADTTRRALAWLTEQGDAPFFLWVHLQDPHGPYEPPARYRERAERPVPPDEAPLPVLSDNRGVGGIPRYQALEGLRRPSEYRARYAGEVLYADEWVGELVRSVESHPSGRSAVVLLTADHGESLGEGGRYFVHGSSTEPPQARIPLLLRAPGIEPGRREGVVGHVDVLPTLLELAGLPVPDGARGIALGPFLREGRALPDRRVYCDRGSELSAYGRKDYLLGRAVPTAAVPRRQATWTRYAWPREGEPFPVERRVAPGAEIARYVDRSPPESPLELDAEAQQRLRNLGYLEP